MTRTPGSGSSKSRDLGVGYSRLPRAAVPEALPDAVPDAADPLGPALDIRQTAALIGCSVWTVRQRLVPKGLPHFRSGPGSKLIFYRNQVIGWLLRHQRQGGI